jgi:hypothetical protein
MATSDTAQTPKSKTRKPAAKRKPAARAASTATQPTSRVAQVQQVAERVVAPLDGVRTRLEREARTAWERLDRPRAQVRRRIPANVEQLTSRVEKVVQDGAKTGMKLVNEAQDRIARVS